ncbi:MAG: hypothetical protein CO133_02365, partial [Candidatus Komeilibacteria bacterium CG_4_9_14_3_um_filter_37_5]
VLSFSFLLATLLVAKYQVRVLDWFYTFAASWLGLIHFLFLASLVLLLLVLIGKWIPILMTYRLVIGVMVYGIALIFFLLALINANQPIIREQIITAQNLPSTWQNKKMVWVSDVHLGSVWQSQTSEKIVRLINDLQADIVIVGGDLFDGAGANAENIAGPWKALQAKQGKYFITGNHEQFTTSQSLLETIRGLGFTILNNEKIDLDGVTIVGIDYQSSTNRDNYQKILNDLSLNKEAPKILWRHVPNFLDISRQYNSLLQIYGHTHVGQLWPFNYITQLVYHGYDVGMHPDGKSLIYTSGGVGTWGPPLRMGNQPEIVLFRFQN